jgi:hypothetical protein
MLLWQAVFWCAANAFFGDTQRLVVDFVCFNVIIELLVTGSKVYAGRRIGQRLALGVVAGALTFISSDFWYERWRRSIFSGIFVRGFRPEGIGDSWMLDSHSEKVLKCDCLRFSV